METQIIKIMQGFGKGIAVRDWKSGFSPSER